MQGKVCVCVCVFESTVRTVSKSGTLSNVCVGGNEINLNNEQKLSPKKKKKKK